LPIVWIVLIVVHFHHQPKVAGMKPAPPLQHCHNRHDALVRAAGLKARAREACAIGDLFACTEVL